MLVVSVMTGQITGGTPICTEQDTGDCGIEFWL
jgi:hypothetical protein